LSASMGQKIESIKENSFWAKAGLKEGDILVKVNNLPLNNLIETKKAFGAAGKEFGFELRRNGETITQFYTCQ